MSLLPASALHARGRPTLANRAGRSRPDPDTDRIGDRPAGGKLPLLTMTQPSGPATLDVPREASARPVDSAPPKKVALGGDRKSGMEQFALGFFVVVPFLALIAAVPVFWGWGLGWHDVVIAIVMYAIAGHGITIGYHRLFTHKAFKAVRPLRVALAFAGGMAIEGPVVRWVADHRRHHAFSDKDGDPHSPWRFGTGFRALTKGLLFAHVGWIFDPEQTDATRYAPDLIADPDIVAVSRLFWLQVTSSLLLPAVIGGLWSMSIAGAVTGFFWGALVRISLLHHVTWSINSICHAVGERPFRTRDKSGNVWWLSVLSMGESWHNLHHADPTSARHGVLRFQLDSSGRTIWLFERFGWAWDVRWPSADRIKARLVRDSERERATASS
jgi:stearoyl-CoA desaturase (Delta-9 desaturase)